MASVMLALFVLFMVVPDLRDFFQLSSLSLANAVIGVVIVALWAIALQYTWRDRWLERWLRIHQPARA